LTNHSNVKMAIALGDLKNSIACNWGWKDAKVALAEEKNRKNTYWQVEALVLPGTQCRCFNFLIGVSLV